MGLLENLSSQLTTDPFIVLLTTITLFLLLRSTYRCTLHPLSHIPGPLIPKLTSLWLHYHAYIGDEASTIHKLHAQYGTIIRVSPTEIDIADADAITPIYITKGGFPKAPCYANFDVDGHKTIFSTTDVEFRAPRAKAVMPLFSTKCIRDSEIALYGCVNNLVRRMRDEAKGGEPVNCLNLARSLALDAISTHLFLENYNGTLEKGEKLSASAFVDAFVAVGRFFYLPNTAFVWLSWLVEKLVMDSHTENSIKLVDQFVDNLVESTPKQSQNYPGRLLNMGFSKSEVKAHCKDLMFAGTDSTGMNLATIFRQLVLNPEKYEILRAEIMENVNSRHKQEIQALPYLSAVVKEGLRISMANPTRLPHIVPTGGWTFKSVYFPAGSIVGCSGYELHFNAEVFPNPHEFQPERWLEGNITAEANKYWFAFGAGSRACIARNLATVELLMAVEKVVENDVLRGARVCQERVEIFEWFNSSVKGEKMELIWS
ncbi:37a5e44e-206e-4990-9005-f5b8ba8e654f [Sclerotinia trifoliorum]|uniref:37a5e44e-206e-4990-9005-f5b8ba8e654f n=1 Tax=Sclerotinia trifoliorum TaxID=28548 RepID=A0A8H2W204_9HELO|nr:37a5e44e-206e-4990-9005-f5b8ba8e654f [Sclerotinia trifoliorum]